ncbi:unnamed protein product [Phytomonas sp. Hart1]|nr:unnamed protein product [Phytomonas sp. Hart1]|eukprot:CCW68098.1 unnamed protein product [Phytomonas sp. isolate Hart1]
MSLFHRIHGATFFPALRQRARASDGLRGVFPRRRIPRGSAILTIPLPYAYFPHGLPPQGPFPSFKGGGSSHERGDFRQLRRENRQIALLPEFWTWLRRLSPDVVKGRKNGENGEVETDAEEEERGSVALSASASLEGSSPAVVSLSLTPVEAALVVCIALRYFFTTALAIPPRTRAALRLGSSFSMDVGELYVRSLPIPLYLTYGLEGFFKQALGDEANAHSCLEQLAWNLRDACLTYASMEEYRLMDTNPSIFDDVLLAVLYIVRARVFQIPLLFGENPLRDRLISVYAPGLDSLNHADEHHCTAAAVVSAKSRSIVVRAVRDILPDEEITFDYSSQNRIPADRLMFKRNARCRDRSDKNSHEIMVGETCESRYLFSRD